MAQDRKKNQEEKKFEVAAEEFIPYAIHYDSNTLLTKNGELLQVIKIVGFNYENIGGEKITLRRAVRRAIQQSIKSNNFALWIHTIRRRRNLNPGGEHPYDFSWELNMSWRMMHDWDHKFVNELYITVIHEGQDLYLRGPQAFMRSLKFSAEKKFREDFLEEASENLKETVDSLLKSLERFGAVRLGMAKKNDEYYSEPLSFISKILNVREVPMPVLSQDVSQYLSVNKVTFGFDALEVSGKTGDHFGVILSIKEYLEVTSKGIDRILQLPIEFIITETVDFINPTQALKHFEYQMYINKLSNDSLFAEKSGLTDIMKSNKGGSTDYGEHQITIMVFSDSILDLSKNYNILAKSLSDLGLVYVREDLFLDQCYWAQLPGNFEFVKRLTPIDTGRIGGFASLHNFPAGRISGNKWGHAVTIFHTALGTPYFFNFHAGESGHTTIMGPYGTGKTVLLNFLLSEATKFNPKIFFFDQRHNSEIFLRSINGSYINIYRGRDPLQPYPHMRKQVKMNPLRLPDNQENRTFLRAWLQYITNYGEIPLGNNEIAAIREVVDYIFTLPVEYRKLAHLAAFLLGKGHSLLADRLSIWHSNGKYAHIFDNEEDELDLSDKIYGFGLTEIIEDIVPIWGVFSYLIYRVRQALDGSPAILVLDEAWTLLDNPLFAKHINEWLLELSQKNCIAIFATENVKNAEESSISPTLMSQIVTQFFLPDKKPDEAYKTIFGLTEEEFELLNSMSLGKRQLLLKHAKSAVVVELNLKGMNDMIAVLSGNLKNLSLMHSLIDEFGENSDQWLPRFMSKISEQEVS